MSKKNYCSSYAKIKPNDLGLTKHYYRPNCENITDCYNSPVNRHRNLHRNLFFKTIEQLELENKARAFLSSSMQARATRVLGTALKPTRKKTTRGR